MCKVAIVLQCVMWAVLVSAPLHAQEEPPALGEDVSQPGVVHEVSASQPAPGEAGLEEVEEPFEEPPVIDELAIEVPPEEKKAFKLEEALAEETFVFNMNARRDPFTYFTERPGDFPEEGVTGGTPGGLVRAPEFLPVGAQERIVKTASAAFARMKQSIAGGDYSGAMQIYERELTPIMKQKHLVTNAKLKGKLDDLEEQAAKVKDLINEAKLNELHKALLALHGRLKAAWQNADYETVVAAGEGFDAIFSEGQSVMVGAGDAAKKKAVVDMNTEVGILRRRAEVRLEFSKKSFSVAGIAWSSKKSFAIINELDMGEGEIIDGVTIVKIRPGRITMEYKGETFEKFVQ